MHYFTYKLNHEIKEIYWHTFLSNLALAIVMIFEPVYLLSLGYGFIDILWFYALVYVGYMIFIFAGAKFASTYGYKHAILFSNFFYVIYWILLFFIRDYPVLFFITPIFFALQKSWFWPAYDAEVALSEIKVQRGREVGVLFVVMQLAFIFGPFLGGFISAQAGFLALFGASSSLALLSVYPLFLSPEIHGRHKFRFINFLNMFRHYKINFFGYFGYAEDLIFRTLWPAYMFLVIPNFASLGAISTLATLAGAILVLYLGKLTDQIDKRKLIRWSALIYGASWFIRSLGQRIGSVLSFDIATKTLKDLNNVPMTALTYERAGNKSPDQAIAYSVFWEFSLSVGKLLTCLLGIWILASGGSIFAVFAVTGLLTMMYGLLK